MGRTRQAKRKLPITARSIGAAKDKLPASASSASTRAVIRQFHVLNKRREQLSREIAGQKPKQRAPALSSESLLPRDELSRVERDLDALGGLKRYQAMSSIGQSVAKGGGSEKVLVPWIKELSSGKLTVDTRRMRLLDVGALKHNNYASAKSIVDVTSIDLHSRHAQIVQQDFMQIDPASDEPFHPSIPSNKNWDIISLSLVLNFVPDSRERGHMLRLAHALLAPEGLLFVVVSGAMLRHRKLSETWLPSDKKPAPQLPLPCLNNSRYLTIEHWISLMAEIGFSKLKERWKEGGKVGYWLFRRCEPPITLVNSGYLPPTPESQPNVSRILLSSMSSYNPSIHAVIFDIGGVVVTSPLIAIADYERERGFPKDWLNVLITGHGHMGAWQRFERGELDLYTFYAGFGKDLSDVKKGGEWYAEYCRKRGMSFPSLPPAEEMRVDGRELFGRMMRGSKFDKTVVRAIHLIRASNRYRLISVTNNFGSPMGDIPRSELSFLGWDAGEASSSPKLRHFFDDYIDSSEVGLRKPDPAIYSLACQRNGVKPEEVVMLDDLGMNLKPAKELGMTTIQVNIGRSAEAIRQLGLVLGLELLEDQDKARSSKL